MASIIIKIDSLSEKERTNMIASAKLSGFKINHNINYLDIFCTNPSDIPKLKSWNIYEGTFRPNKKTPRIQKLTTPNIRAAVSTIPKYPNSFNMNQIAKIYSIPNPSNEKYVVGVISFGGGLYGNVSSNGVLSKGDVQNYWTALGIPESKQPTVIIRLLPGAKNVPNINDDGATIENTLDVETIGGACPSSNLTIILYIAPDTESFYGVLSYIYKTKINGITPNLISCSWGLSEIYVSEFDLTATNTILKLMTAKGINICVATGDDGSNNGVGGTGKYVDFPSSSPYATAVGGTTLKCPNFTYDSHTVETTWSTTGGGFSSKFDKPSYQSSITASGRSTPDIASCADPNTGVIFYIGGSYQVIGGTSVSAPTIAGYLAAIGVKQFINPLIYSVKSNCYNDILYGSNGAYIAKIGYDNCTGRGSINGNLLKQFFIPSVQRSYIKKIPLKKIPRKKIPHAEGETYFKVSDYVSIYNFPAPSDKPYVIAVASFGGGLFGTAEPDTSDPTLIKITNGDGQKYWTNTLGIPLANQPLVLIKLMPGATNNPSKPDTATGENTLDITTLGGACPSSALTIILYIAPSATTSNYDLYNFIYTTPVVSNGVTYRPNVISSSWGNSESTTGTEDMNNTNKLFQTITSAGINIISAAGDNLAQNGGTGFNVDFPASSPYATTLGGTTLISPNNIYDADTTETVWNTKSPDVGTGGGISTYFPKPSYQNITALSGTTFRSIPDITLVANPGTGIILYINGVPDTSSSGGTSMSSPLFAAFLACINCKKWVNPILYSSATSSSYLTYFHDITVGNNCPGGIYNPATGYNSAVGYDSCSGWGSINGLTLQNLLSDLPCTDLTVSPTSVTVPVSETVQLVSSVTPNNATNKTLVYISSNPSIATVSNTGLVTGIAAGTTNVFVRTTDGSDISVTVPVTVTQADILCTSLTVSPTDVLIETNNLDGRQLVATITPEDATDKTLTYTSSNPLIATVSNTGLVKGIKGGSADIVVRTTDGSNLSFTVPVNVTQSDIYCTGLTVSPTSVTVPVSEIVQLVSTVTPVDATNKTLSYTSSNPLIATVSNTGLITGVAVGTTNVIVRTTDPSDLSITVPVNVTQSDIYCTGLTVYPTSVTLEKTKTVQLVSDVTPFEATDKTLSYTSSNPLIATVSNTGLITGVAVGATSVIVRTTDGSNLSVTVPVTVTQADILCTSLTVSPKSVALQVKKTSQIVSTVTPVDATNKTLTYTSSNPLIATVSNTGLVTGVAIGTTSVIVRTTDGSNLSVTVPIIVISEPICVVRGTRIMMADGTSKPIQDIERGDRVLCDKESGVFQKVARLTEMMHNGKAIQIPRGLIGNKKKLIMTPEHPIWIKNENRMYSKHIKGAIPLTISEKVYNIQFEEEGTYYAEGIKVDSMSPNFYQMKLPKDLFFNSLKHNKRLFVQEEDDPVRRKPKMIQI